MTSWMDSVIKVALFLASFELVSIEQLSFFLPFFFMEHSFLRHGKVSGQSTKKNVKKTEEENPCIPADWLLHLQL